VASFFFAPKTLNSLTVQEAHKRLGMAAIDAIEGFRAVLTYRLLTHVTIKDTDFEVEFATWDENDGGGRRVFAVYRNGGLELTSPSESDLRRRVPFLIFYFGEYGTWLGL